MSTALPGTDAIATAEAVRCAHCTLPVPAGLVDPDGADSFCCSGCRGAWELLHTCGLDQYYRFAERRDEAVRTADHAYDALDHEAFTRLYVRFDADALAVTDLWLEGLHCASCVWLLERTPRLLDGLARVELDVARRRVRVSWDPERTRLSTVAALFDRLGYAAHPYRGATDEELRRREERTMLGAIGVAGALAGNIMMIAVAMYAGWFGHMDAATERYFRWWSLLLTTPALFWPGRTFLRGAWSALRTRTLHMDVPIALALGAGYARGLVNTWTDRGPVYFDGVATLVFLLLVGRFLQQRAQRAAMSASELMHALAPGTARVIGDDGRERELPSEALVPGMTLALRPGDVIAADGVVTAGASHLDLAMLTGESRPIAVREGDAVYAGTAVHGAPLRVRVERTGEESRIGRILADVERGAHERAPIVHTADRLAGGFVAVVLVLAALAWGIGARLGDPGAFDHAIALLVVTCPCALALATPLAFTVAIGRAARAGLLIKSGAALERLARPGMLFLDKTGTITTGRHQLVEWHGDARVRAAVLALERHSSHPIARGFERAWPGLAAATARDVHETAGGGIEGRVGSDHVLVGSPAWIASRADTRARLAPAPAPHLTPVWVAVNGEPVAVAGFGDPARADAAPALARLRAAGWRVRVLSGDEPAVVQATGAALGFAPDEVLGACSPEDKRALVAEAEADGPTVMVGDGVNDAAAIARASTGVAVHGGAEIAARAADVFVTREGLQALVALSDGATRTLRVVRWALAFSLVYNAVGAGLALAGRIDPLLAAILMPASSLTVVWIAWRSRTFEVPRARAAEAPDTAASPAAVAEPA